MQQSRMRHQDFWVFLAAYAGGVLAQDFPSAEVQNNTFNATHGPYNPDSARERMSQANLSAELSHAVLTALNYERSNWAGTSVRLDPFYMNIPSNWTGAPAGSVIKVEQYTDPSLYTLQPAVALSRLIYTTKTLNGTVIPASAFILWPWIPRSFDTSEADGLPVIGWAHGSSGQFGECGPSHIRNLIYHLTLFAAANQGYAIVAPDYAGLGLDHDGEGNFIPHQFLSTQAQGNDVLYAVRAAQKAWPDVLGSRYVVMGHSQGGGAAWGASTVLGGNGSDVEELRRGYLGTIAGSPWTSFNTFLAYQTPIAFNWAVAQVATGIRSVFPSFTLDEWLTEKGVRLVELFQDLQGCRSVGAELLLSGDLARDDWNTGSWYAESFNDLTSNIARPFAGPLLVLQGTGDSIVNVTGVRNAVNATCEAVPGAQLELIEFEGVTHGGLMFAAQRIWLDWIADRFAGKEASSGCQKQQLSPLKEVSTYVTDQNWFIEWSQYMYSMG